MGTSIAFPRAPIPAISIAAAIESFYRSALNAYINWSLTGKSNHLFPNMHIQVSLCTGSMHRVTFTLHVHYRLPPCSIVAPRYFPWQADLGKLAHSSFRSPHVLCTLTDLSCCE